jgi:hypothetical protein
MSGVARAEAKLTVDSNQGIAGPFSVLCAESVTNWVGPFTIQIATGASEQSVIVIGTQGLTTITDIMITSDTAISVTYGAAASNVPVPLGANKVHLVTGTSLTALSITNASGVTATVTYLVAGA